jgi:hypothetical protein
MRKEFYRNMYQFASVDLEKGLFCECFNPESSTYTDETYKEDFLNFSQALLSYTKTHKFPYGLVDMRNFFFTISPELQEWHNENIFKLNSQIGLERMAILSSIDLIASLSIEQTLDNTDETFQTRFFDNEEDALAWLFV